MRSAEWDSIIEVMGYDFLVLLAPTRCDWVRLGPTLAKPCLSLLADDFARNRRGVRDGWFAWLFTRICIGERLFSEGEAPFH